MSITLGASLVRRETWNPELSAVVDDHSRLTWGMVFLMAFTLAVVGRMPEVVPTLASLRVVLVTGALAAFAWFLGPGSIRDKVPFRIKTVRYVLALLALAIITIPVAVWPGRSFRVVTGGYWKLVLLFLMVVYFCRSVRDVDRVIWVCCLGPLGLVIHGLLFGSEASMRFSADSLTYDPNDLALILVMLLPLMLYLFSFSGSGLRFLILGLVVVSLYGIVLTQSRGGFVALLVVSTLLLWRGGFSRSAKLLLVGMVVFVFAGLSGVSYWDRIETIWAPRTENDRTMGDRTGVWKTGVKLMMTKPWGVGIGGFRTAEGLSHGGEGKWSAAHNSFLQIGVELGIAGLVLFSLLIGLTIRQLRELHSLARKPTPASNRSPPGKRLAHRRDPTGVGLYERRLSGLAAALETSFWGFLVGGFLLSHAYSYVLYVLLGLSLSCRRLAEPLLDRTQLSVSAARMLKTHEPHRL